MYKSITLSELKKHLELPKDYKVDSFLIYGSYDENRYKKEFLSLLKGKKFSIEKLKHGFIKKILSVKMNNKRVWFCTEYGGARLSEFLHFACMLGSKKNILIGCCGGLQKGLDNFTFIVPNYSYSTDSSPHMYMRNNKNNLFSSSKDLSKEIKESLKEKGLKVITGPTVTCQAMMGETWEDVLSWEKKGFYGVEMEASTVFSVSRHFNVPSAAIIQVADNLIENEMVVSESYLEKKREIRKFRKEMIKVAITTIFK